MHERTSQTSHRTVWSIAGVLVCAVLILAFLAWRHPLWLLDHAQDVRLTLDGVHSEYVPVDGYRIHYLEGGSGKPLVLVHGLGSRASDWAPLIPLFVHSGYHVYALDLLGYGLSSQPTDAPYSIPQEASIVEGFLQTQHLARVDLAGWSMGGWIAMMLASAHPSQVQRLVLLDSAGIRFDTDFDPRLFEPDSPAQLDHLEALLTPQRRAVPTFVTRAILRRGKKYGWVVRRSMDFMLTGNDLMDGKLGTLTMPVLIGWGKEDRLIPLSTAYKLHAEMPQSVLAIYDGCGHLAPSICAKQVGPNVLGFLNAEPPLPAQVQQVAKH